MTIEELAKTYKLKTKKVCEGEYVIPGKLGEIYMYDEDEGLVGAMFLSETPTKGWAFRKKEFTKAGASIVQNGEYEGAVSFPATDKALMKLAIKLLGVRTKRTVSETERKKLTDRLTKARQAKGR